MKFTDKKFWVQGIGTMTLRDPETGDILHQDDKFSSANIAFSGNDGEIKSGLGNNTVIMIPTDAQINVTITADDYSEFIKAKSVGAQISAGAPTMTCKTVTATGSTLSIGTGAETPVAALGMSRVICHVQEVGAPSDIEEGGVAYPISPETGNITGFVAEAGKTYLVTYFAMRANASKTTYTSVFKGEVFYFEIVRPYYKNYDSATKAGTLSGWVHEIIPQLQLRTEGAGNDGNQTSHTTTTISGRALPMDTGIVTGDCDQCGSVGSPTMYRVIVPCDELSGIQGIHGKLGGLVTVRVGETEQLKPLIIVNNKLATGTPPSDFTYVSSASGKASVGAHTGVVTGVSTGSAQITVTYAKGGQTFTDRVDVSVTN